MLVAIGDWNNLSRKAVGFALTLSQDVIGVHLTQLSGPERTGAQRHESLRMRWERDVAEPARAAGLPARGSSVCRRTGGCCTPIARRLRAQLLRHGGPGLTVIEVPWHPP